MKPILRYISLVLFFFQSFICSAKYYNYSLTDSITSDWTESEYHAYEDSIYSMLYSEVIAKKADSTLLVTNQIESPNISFNSKVPTSINIDLSKEVGQINILSGMTPTGAKTYEVPINVYPGVRDMQPNLSLTYNSQHGNSILGIGWSISGIPMITRSGKTIYYNNKTESVLLDYSDSFALDGMHLIQTKKSGNQIFYESEFGKIIAKGYISGNNIRYFEVFYPNGNKGVFGYNSENKNTLAYPLIYLTDLHGNTINYSYTESHRHFNIDKIDYNGASVEFNYTDRPDSILIYCAGNKILEPKLLQSITCKLDQNILGTYSFDYSLSENDITQLNKIDYSSEGKSFNPLYFYYGEGLRPKDYAESTTQLYEWYESDNLDMIKVVKGKFDYDSGSDGLIVLPNLNPYWEHYNKSERRFDNKFSGNEKIYLYAGLKDNFVSPMPNLLTEKGFIDILCADLIGKQEEYIIKINNTVVNNSDRITFNVYRSNVYSGLSKLYTRTFDFATVYTDSKGVKSIQPKYYYTGDFNGDGKMEVMAIAVHQPFGDITLPSVCYLFDLENNKLLYKSNLVQYNVDFLGTRQTDPKAAFQNTDRLFVMDYDGDGKSDLCLINEKGVNIYTFFETSNSISGKHVRTYYGLKKSDLANKVLLPGEFNGDGLMDLLISPSDTYSGDYTWSLYNSEGNGLFEKSTFMSDNNTTDVKYLIQDINGDGKTDLLRYNEHGMMTYLAANNSVRNHSLFTSYSSKESILIPTDINTRNSFTQLISLKKGIVTKYSFPRNDSKEEMITGMVNSLGVIEKNEYCLLNEENLQSFFTKGSGAVFPYINIKEPLAVIASSELYLNGNLVDNNKYSYHNAVVHRHGLGFCGFEKITKNNMKGQSLIQTYMPYCFNLLKSEVTPSIENTYTYDVNTQSNKISKICLTTKEEKDLLKNISSTTSYSYDYFGYPTDVKTEFTGNISINKKYEYSQESQTGDGYNLGFITRERITINRDSSSYTEERYVPLRKSRLANLEVYYKDGNQIEEKWLSYDSIGNIISEKVKMYTASDMLETSYEYDIYGRITKRTDPLGLTEEIAYNSLGQPATINDYREGTTSFSYDAFGREISVSYPDGTQKNISYDWNSEGIGGIYSITESKTGKPTTTIVYDGLNREIRSCEIRFDGIIKKIDKQYDIFGNLQKESLPFTDNEASFWTTYSYDSHNRLLSITEPSGKITNYSYNGTSIECEKDNIVTTRDYDVLDNLIFIGDSDSSTYYNLSADGQPETIEAPGEVTTSFYYDKYRRQIALEDPSAGKVTYDYDEAGNIAKETNAKGEIIQHEYDAYNRRIKSTTTEFTTTYEYNEFNEITGLNTDNGSSKSFSYDQYGRLSVYKENGIDGKWLQKKYSYANGNISSIKYTSQSGVLATENYSYSNGHLSEVKLNGTTSILKLNKENSFGLPTEIISGGITRQYTYSEYGYPASRSVNRIGRLIQNHSYTFDSSTSNLSSRTDGNRNITENFSYDHLNRLSSYDGESVSYDIKGNITNRSDIGAFSYTIASKPYAISKIEPTGTAIPERNQKIDYTSFGRPKSIVENDYKALISYNGDYDRIKMVISKDQNDVLTRYYLGSCYEIDNDGTSSLEKLYLFGGYYDSPAVLVNDGSQSILLFIIRDYLGSITHLTASNGVVIQELSYDAWGRLRDPSTHKVYEPGSEPAPFLGRGYTGHEHLTQFGLINMNARLYDPALGRFLSPDPNVQMPFWPQNFNRYSYAMNNPLYYIDEDGEFFWAFVGAAAIIGAVVNVATHWDNIKSAGGWKGFWKGAGYALAGAAAGGIGAAVGIGAVVGFGSMVGVTAASFTSATTGFLGGATFGGASGAASGFVMETTNALLEGNSFGTALNKGIYGAASGGAFGTLAGGFSGGIKALRSGKKFWSGEYTNKTLIQLTATKAEQHIGGTGRVAGTQKHKYASDLLNRYQSIVDERYLKTNVTHPDYGRKYILDIYDPVNRIIYDYKFGYPNMTPQQLNNIPQMRIYREIWKAKSIIIKP